MTGNLSIVSQSSDTDPRDRALLSRIAENRDVVAMESIYVSYRPRLVGFLRRLTRDDDLIEESYNDVMVSVWEKAHQYQSRSKVSSWIFSIAYRSCLRMVKKQQRRDAVIDLVGQELPEIAETVAEPEVDSARIKILIKKLPAKQRLVIELCYFEGYSTEEIGVIVKAPVNTVKTRLHHARLKIRKLLEIERSTLQSSTRSV